jgi:hypothetical protein
VVAKSSALPHGAHNRSSRPGYQSITRKSALRLHLTWLRMRTYGIIGDLITFGVTVSTKHLHNPRERDAIKPTLDNSLFHQKVVRFIPCINQCSSLWISDPGSVGASDISPLISMVPKCVNEPSRSGSNIWYRYFNSQKDFGYAIDRYVSASLPAASLTSVPN